MAARTCAHCGRQHRQSGAAYARLSVNRQNSASISDQRRAMIGLACEHDVDLPESMILVDEGISGAKGEAGRPGYAAWLAAAVTGEATVLIAYAMDRATRAGLDEFVKITGIVTATGARLLTVADRLDSQDPNFEMIAGVRAVVDQQYRRSVQQKQLRRHATDRRNGVWHPIAPWPYGSKTRAGKLVPDPEQLAVLRDLMTMVDAGESYRSIATQMTGRGRYIARRDADGLPVWEPLNWAASLVQKVLRRPILAGWHEHAGALVRDDHGDLAMFAETPALTASEYTALQSTLDQRSQPRGLSYRGPARGQAPAHPLSGLLRCPCGSLLWADVRTRGDGYASRPVWRCRRRQGNRAACTERAIPIAETETGVRWLILQHVVNSDPADLLPVAEALAAQEAPEATADRRAALDAVAAAEAALADLEAARYDRGEFAGREARYAELHTRAAARLAAARELLAAAPLPPDVGALADPDAMAAALDHDLARWARMFAVSITVHPDRLAPDWR